VIRIRIRIQYQPATRGYVARDLYRLLENGAAAA
jgi:hypothetical protein